MTELEHQPDPATYNCRGCGKPWPCAPERERLAATMDPIDLGTRMWTELEQAAEVLAAEPPGALFDRFMAWTDRIE